VSELEPGYEYGEEELGEQFTPPASDLAAWADAEPAPGSSVTSRFFHPNGEPRDEPLLKSSDAYLALLDARGELQAPSGPQAPDATVAYDPGPGDQWTAEQDLVSYVDALQRQQQMESDRALFERVGELGKRVDVDDVDALSRVAGQVHQQVSSWWQEQLAAGATVRQGEATFASSEFQGFVDGLIEQSLQHEAYRHATRNTATRRALDADWERQSIEHSFGGPPPRPIWIKYPGLQKMASAMAGYAQRQAERDAQLQSILDEHRAHAVQTKAARDAAYEATKTRRIINR
jgi:hypothetical protein